MKNFCRMKDYCEENSCDKCYKGNLLTSIEIRVFDDVIGKFRYRRFNIYQKKKMELFREKKI